jgi:hypothetical protein
MNATLIYRTIARIGLCVTLAVAGFFGMPQARADMLLLSQTTLVEGTESTLATLTVPSPGALNVTLSNIAWPLSLDSLSFMLSSSDQVISAWSTTTSNFQSYNVTPGTYFVHVTGSAAGTLDLGVYSITATFQPAGVVPLPASGVLLLCGVLLIAALARSRRNARVMPSSDGAPAPSAS